MGLVVVSHYLQNGFVRVGNPSVLDVKHRVNRVLPRQWPNTILKAKSGEERRFFIGRLAIEIESGGPPISHPVLNLGRHGKKRIAIFRFREDSSTLNLHFARLGKIMGVGDKIRPFLAPSGSQRNRQKKAQHTKGSGRHSTRWQTDAPSDIVSLKAGNVLIQSKDSAEGIGLHRRFIRMMRPTVRSQSSGQFATREADRTRESSCLLLRTGQAGSNRVLRANSVLLVAIPFVCLSPERATFRVGSLLGLDEPSVRIALFDHQPVGMKLADDNIHVVPPFDGPSRVGEGHPVGPSGFFGGALTQLTDLFQGGYGKPHTEGRDIKEGVDLLVIEDSGPARVEDTIGKANQGAGFDGFDAEALNTPNQAEVFSGSF